MRLRRPRRGRHRGPASSSAAPRPGRAAARGRRTRWPDALHRGFARDPHPRVGAEVSPADGGDERVAVRCPGGQGVPLDRGLRMVGQRVPGVRVGDLDVNLNGRFGGWSLPPSTERRPSGARVPGAHVATSTSGRADLDAASVRPCHGGSARWAGGSKGRGGEPRTLRQDCGLVPRLGWQRRPAHRRGRRQRGPRLARGVPGCWTCLRARKCSSLLTRLLTKCSQNVVAGDVTVRHCATSREEIPDQAVFGGSRQHPP